MADFDSSLPIRTETNGDVVGRIVDGTVTSQFLTVNADGSLNITDNGGSLTVDATDLDIRDLTSASDSVEVLQATHDNLNANANLQVGDADVDNTNPVPVSDAGGSLTVDATDLDIRDLAFATDKVDATGSEVSLDAATLAALESITVQNGAGAAAVNIQDGGNSITVDATDLDIRDLTHVSDSIKVGDGTDFLAVNTDGSINVVISDATPGTAINNYNTAAAVAGGATSNHDYTVTSLKTLSLNQIEASGTGKMKIEVQVETAVASGVFNTSFVQFNSTADTNMTIHIDNPISVAAGVRVRIIRTNRENQAQDLYSTICGYELP